MQTAQLRTTALGATGMQITRVGFGRAERIAGRALAGLRDRPLVFTKCSLLERALGDAANLVLSEDEVASVERGR
jgi:hypothetical protein